MAGQLRENPSSGSSGTNPLFGRGMIALFIAILVIAALFAFFIMSEQGSRTTVPMGTCAQQAVAYVNSNLIQTGSSAQLGSVGETNGVYRIMIQYQGSEIPLYATKDCSLLFTNTYTITPAACDAQAGACSPSAAGTTPAPVAPVKSARPVVELYVMSFCPYGVQVENAMKPVVDLLGSSMDMKVRYIATVTGDSVATAQSLHGNAEAVEDTRQLCIAKHSPGSYWGYIAAFDAQCYPAWNDAAKLSLCQKNITAALGIQSDAVDACVSGTEGLQLLRADETAASANQATASPTILINGQRYSGARTAEAFKQAICSHFETPPQACDTALSSQAATASGSC